MKKIVLLSFIIGLVGCSSNPIDLPSNIKTIPTGMGNSTYIDEIDKSFQLSTDVSFEKIKACSVDVITNDSVVLRDSAGSFVGVYTGNYYQNKNSSVVQGGNLFKYVDDSGKSLVASGRIKTNPQQGGLIVDIVQYDAKISLNKNNINLKFQNIKAAQENTGGTSNVGFRNIGTWSGARAPAAISAIDQVATKFKNCVN
ncbi:hypothetical protein MMP61_17110 [Acinetobacter sp. NIPH 1958]|uniref:hypothetical protein n=1 Tax=Acinetobacter sp. NIPH 1958 TaxID=2923430 RepID=UPI001F4BCAE9|nr:hypothetical protein [Acinetobacter sp. NIPH 1958]MCH7357267.1 hypothetical protein [Acinetobacter sp. NIPH 1958]